MKRLLIFGLGASGQGLLQYLAPKYPEIWVMDDTPFHEDELSTKYSTKVTPYAEGMEIDRVLLSPGISPAHPLIQKWKKEGVPLQSELDFAAEQLTGEIIAITGTNGKSTTSAWCAHILGVQAAGNIGTALSSVLCERNPPSWHVLEVSSFQLEFSHSLHPRYAAILNITPDHMDWHGSLEAYIAAKKKIYEHMGEGDSLLLGADSPMLMAQKENIKGTFALREFSLQREVERGAFMKEDELWLREEKDMYLLSRKELSLQGDHNLANALACASLSYCAGARVDAIRRGLREYKGLRHRYEVLGEARGRRFINDSKATNAESTLPALRSAKAPTIVLLGGYDKGGSYDSLFREELPWIKAVVCFGETGEMVAKSARDHGFKQISLAHDLEEAFYEALRLSEEGDDILLSPASASWDAYANFEARGDHFRSLFRRWSA